MGKIANAPNAQVNAQANQASDQFEDRLNKLKGL